MDVSMVVLLAVCLDMLQTLMDGVGVGVGWGVLRSSVKT